MSTPHFLWVVATRPAKVEIEFFDDPGFTFSEESGSALELFSSVDSDARLVKASNELCTSNSFNFGANAPTVELEMIAAMVNKESFIFHDRTVAMTDSEERLLGGLNSNNKTTILFW